MRGGIIPYAWDPSVDDDQDGTDEDDSLHKLDSVHKPSPLFNHRSVLNVGVLIILIGALLSLFIAYPVITYVEDNNNVLFLEESSFGSTYNLPQNDIAVHSSSSSSIDSATPQSAMTRTGYDGFNYNLVFSDEFETDGRSFSAGKDSFWEAVNLGYGATGDGVWYDEDQIYTANGSLHIRIDNVATNGMPYRSGMLQSWNKFCFTSGYIEVALTLPGPNQETSGYVSS
jgi:hypothetical protein